MDFKEINELVESCRKEFHETLADGRRPPPTGFVIFDLYDNQDDSDMNVAIVTMSRQLDKVSDVEDLAKHIKSCTDENVVAAGMLALMPESVWSRLLGPEKMPSSTVGVLYVEYLASSFKTWILTLDGIKPVEWNLHTVSYRSKLPPLISDKCYGIGVGRA